MKQTAQTVLLILVGAAASFLQAAPVRRRSVSPVSFPSCTVIIGTPAVAFTRDEGRSLIKPAEALSGIGYTYGLTALDATTLLSWHRDTLSISIDGGCSWRPLAEITSDFPPALTASGGRAFAWSDNRRFLVRYDRRGVASLKAPGAIVGMAIDARNPDRVRAATNEDGAIWESVDGGDSWTPVGRIGGQSIYRVAFDPSDLDHIVAGSLRDGAAWSRDGGRTWQSSNLTGANVFNVVFSPADSNYVWALALPLEPVADSALLRRGIYLSVDGGSSFNALLVEGPAVTLTNSSLLAPHPANRNVLYFVFGSSFQNYGTDLYRFDRSSRDLGIAHNSYDGIDAIAFSPVDPTVMYFGLETERGVR